MHRFAAVLGAWALLSGLLEGVGARTIAQLGPGFGPGFGPDDRETELSLRPQSGSTDGYLSQLLAWLSNVTLSGLWDKLTGPSSNAGSQVPCSTLFANFAIAASLCFFVIQWHRRRNSRFDAEPEITLHRRLFDASSSGKLRSLGIEKSRLLELTKSGLQCTVAAAMSIGFAFILLKYVDASYIIMGCFAAIALTYDSQQNQVLKDGQKRLGLDLVA